jgi:hypothetical protein
VKTQKKLIHRKKKKKKKKIHQKTQMKKTHRRNKLESRKLQRVAIHVEGDALLQHGGPFLWPVQRVAHLRSPGQVKVY